VSVSQRWWVQLLDELFVMRVDRRMSAGRALAYLAVVAIAVLYGHRRELSRPLLFAHDAHAEMSLGLAINRAFCGTPSSITRNPNAAALLLEQQQSLGDEPLASIVSTHSGSINDYCGRPTEPHANNENSLMLTEAWLLRALPRLSLNGLGQLLLGLKLGGLILLCLALLQCGVGVVATGVVAFAGTSLVLAVQAALGGFSVYGFLTSLLAGMLGVYGLFVSRSTSRTFVPMAIVTGITAAYAANMRTSYLPVWLLMLAIVLIAMSRRRVDALTPRRVALGVASFAVGYLAFHFWFIVRTRPPEIASYSYHVIAHPLVLSLAIPSNDLATREGIEWSDGIGLMLARRVDPAVRYMGNGYDRALFEYYMRLWREYPREMRQLYFSKWRLAGVSVLQKASFESSFLSATLWPWRQVPNGFWFFAVFAGSAALGAVLSLQRPAPVFVVLTMSAVAAVCLLTEAAIIMPSFALMYHQTLLFVCVLLTVIGAQAVVNLVVVAGTAVWKARRESEGSEQGALSLAERTIADFGEQWTAYTDNSGFYGSPALLQDVFGPLLDVSDLKGAVVADIGAGTGRFTNVFVSTGVAKVVAVEPSRAFDSLTSNTAALGDRVECVHSAVEQFRAAAPVDFAFSYGVLHHIPDPRCAVAAMRDALKSGGRIGIWLYGREGNEIYVALLTVLTSVTRRLPHAWLEVCVWIVYVPTVVYMWLCRILPLPLRDYFRDVFSRLSPDKRRLTIYDQLNPAYAKYYWQQEVRGLLTDAGFVDVQLFHRHGYSWTALAVKP
jgi:SAM-dependent methyltransferase